MTVTYRRIATLLASVMLVAFALAGCSPSAPTQRPSEEPAEAAAAIRAMSPDAKRASMAEQFPIEVPVPAGEVTRARAQGLDAWDYEVVVDATPKQLAQWYADSYTGRSWTIVDSGELTEGRGGYYLELRKNAAESRVDILLGEQDAPTTVRAVVGIGAPVLGTF